MNEGSSASVGFSNPFAPSSIDTEAGFRYSYDLNNDGVFEIAGDTSFTATVPAQYLPDGPSLQIVQARIEDKDGGYTDYTAQFTVQNVAPHIASVANNAPEIGDAAERQAVGVSATFTDVGLPDSHTALIDWGDGRTTAGFVVEQCGSGSVSASHSYQQGGIFANRVVVTDVDGSAASEMTTAYVTGAGINDGVLQTWKQRETT